MPASSRAIHESSSVCVQLTSTCASAPANTRNRVPTTPAPGAGESSAMASDSDEPGAATTSMAAALAAPSTPSTRTVAQVRSPGRVANTIGSPATNSRYSRASSPMPVVNTSEGAR